MCSQQLIGHFVRNVSNDTAPVNILHAVFIIINVHTFIFLIASSRNKTVHQDQNTIEMLTAVTHVNVFIYDMRKINDDSVC